MTKAPAHSELKVAVVCGGAGGIGRAVVMRLARDGFLPVILDSNEAAGAALLEQLKAGASAGEFLAINLASRRFVIDAFERLRARFRRLDLLVNLAGGTLHAHPVQDFPLEEWLRVIDVNLSATFFCCQAAVPVMKAHGGGVIVNTASNFGVTGSATRTAYSSAKAAVIALTKSLALELRPHGIRVNAIAPGLTATERVMKMYDAQSWAEQALSIPMRRVGEPDDIAEGVAFLAGEDGKFISGETLHVNGGLVLP
jgi:NAD(P)-dependent dehydrogenase (short-subunit alcohol dehydrogenase family)